jgi:hypothetical protein
MTASLSRRSMMAATVGAATIFAAPGAFAARHSMLFEVMRGGTLIGTHRLDFSRIGEDLVVDVAIDLAVEIAWIPVFRYEHANREVWRSGRLMTLESRTHDDGNEHFVRGFNDGERLIVESDQGQLQVEADMLTTSYWHPLTPGRDRLLDTQKGRIADVRHVSSGLERMVVAGQSVQARRYEASGDLELTIWYSLQHAWCGLAFEARGEQVEYQAVVYPDQESWMALAAMAGA